MTRDGLGELLACPNDGGDLARVDSSFECTTCGSRFGRGQHGYLELFGHGDPAAAFDTTAAHPATGSERGETRLYQAYLRPWLQAQGATRVLDAGCGQGLSVASMLADGLDAYGIDLPSASASWHAAAHDPDHYVCGNVARLPFKDGVFDAIVSIGVVEHIGTTTGQITMAPGHDVQRAAFARELLRVTRPGGRILLSCPNKRFPIDMQHGPRDSDTRAPVRTWLFGHTGLNVHRVVGRYHLASYSDIRRWFRGRPWRALPLEDFFGFSSFGRADALSARLASRYVRSLPALLRRTPLNPYVLVEVTA